MHNYTRVSLIHISEIGDGEHVLIMGRYERHLHGATLSQRGKTLDLIGEPYDWLPPQEAAIEVWGVLLQGPQPRLMVHNARRVGDTERAPQQPKDVCLGDTVTLHARVTQYGEQQVCCTAERHTFLLPDAALDERLYLITGQVQALCPPILRLISAVPIPTQTFLKQGEKP